MRISAFACRPSAHSLSFVLSCLALGACAEGNPDSEWVPGPGTSTNGTDQSAGTTGATTGNPGVTTGNPGATTGNPGATTGNPGSSTTGDMTTTTGTPDGGGAGEMDAGTGTAFPDGGMQADASVQTDATVQLDGSMTQDGGGGSDAALDGEVPDDGAVMTDGETPDGSMSDAESPDASMSDADAESPDGSTEDGSTEDAGEEEPDWATRDDLGEGDGSDVVTIGDSWMSNSLFTGDAIEGALDRAGTDYRHYAEQGVMLLGGNLFGAAIPTQFERAVRDDSDIKTVLMTGGGNDVIQSAEVEQSCAEGGELCEQKLEEIADALEELWADMAAAGVQDVVYVAYSSDAGSAGDSANTSASGVQERCQEAPLNCHILETTELVDGDLMLDGIHPARSANNRMAAALLEMMEERKMRR